MSHAGNRLPYAIWVIAILLFILFIAYIKAGACLSLNPAKTDFGKFYESARLYWEGKNIYTRLYFDFNDIGQYSRRIGVPGNLNAPFFTVLTLPLGLIGYQLALYTWLALSALMGIASAWLLAVNLRHSLNKPFNALTILFPVITLIVFSFFPSFSNIIYGQTGLFLLLLFCLSWDFARNEQDRGAGLLLGIACSIKIFVGLLFIFFLMRRQWRLLAWFAGTFVVCNVISLALFGGATYFEYYKTLHLIQWYASTWNASILGMAGRIFGMSEGNQVVWDLPHLASILHKIISAMLMFGIWSLVKSTDKHSLKSLDIGFSYTLVAMLLISPLGWFYYFPILLIVYSVIVIYTPTTRYLLPVIFLSLIAIMLSNIPSLLLVPKDIKTISIGLIQGGIYFYALLLLIIVSFLLAKERLSYNKAYAIPARYVMGLMIIILTPSILSILMFAVNCPVKNVLDNAQIVACYR